MAAVSVQCPNCGAPVSGAVIGSAVSCASCGSALEIRESSAGYPLARLTAIHKDTSLMARRQAVEILQEKLSRLEADRASLEMPAVPGFSLAPYRRWLPLGLFISFIAAVVAYARSGTRNLLVIALIVFAIYSVMTLLFIRVDYDADVKTIRAQIGAVLPRQEALDRQIEECRTQIAVLESDITHIINEMTARN